HRAIWGLPWHGPAGARGPGSRRCDQHATGQGQVRPLTASTGLYLSRVAFGVQDARHAREVAESLLAEPLPRRWAHTQGVAAVARRIAPIVGEDAELLQAAA